MAENLCRTDRDVARLFARSVTLDPTGHCPQLSAPPTTSAAIASFAAAGR